MLALHLVALGRPGWFVPNSADAVRTKALHQEENLSEKLLFRKSRPPIPTKLTMRLDLDKAHGAEKETDLQPWVGPKGELTHGSESPSVIRV